MKVFTNFDSGMPSHFSGRSSFTLKPAAWPDAPPPQPPLTLEQDELVHNVKEQLVALGVLARQIRTCISDARDDPEAAPRASDGAGSAEAAAGWAFQAPAGGGGYILGEWSDELRLPAAAPEPTPTSGGASAVCAPAPK